MQDGHDLLHPVHRCKTMGLKDRGGTAVAMQRHAPRPIKVLHFLQFSTSPSSSQIFLLPNVGLLRESRHVAQTGACISFLCHVTMFAGPAQLCEGVAAACSTLCNMQLQHELGLAQQTLRQRPCDQALTGKVFLDLQGMWCLPAAAHGKAHHTEDAPDLRSSSGRCCRRLAH